jgi:hypothetical protein
MTLDDVYGSDLDCFPPEREVCWKTAPAPRLEWDETAVTDVRENGPPVRLYAEWILESRRSEFSTVH